MKLTALTLILAAILTADVSAQWTVVGPAKACSDGTLPQMIPQGPPMGQPIPPGQHHQLVVTGPQGASAFLVVGNSFLGAQFKGGVLGPQPTLLVPFQLGSGKAIFVFDWPTGLPPGQTAYLQAILNDGSAYCMTETWQAVGE